jgi:DNA-binding transcriptional ArsR family regulator
MTIIHFDMNDDTKVSAWQDGVVSDQERGPAEAEAGLTEPRQVSDVETLKVLADPTRLAILTALMGPGRAPLRVMSVKELAAELGEPQTKLYRHVKQLEAADLIHVAASRLVSGILEQRYQASQRDLMFGPGLLRDRAAAADETEPVVATLLDRFRNQFFAAHRAGLIVPGDYPPEEAYRNGMMALIELRVSARRAAAIRLRLQEVMDELNAPDVEDPDGVPVNLLIGFHSADPAAGGQPA